MTRRFIISVVGSVLLIVFYLYFQHQKRTQKRVECVVEAGRTIINIYEGDQLARSTGFGEIDIVDWYKRLSKPRKLAISGAIKKFRTINAEQGILTYQQNSTFFIPS